MRVDDLHVDDVGVRIDVTLDEVVRSQLIEEVAELVDLGVDLGVGEDLLGLGIGTGFVEYVLTDEEWGVEPNGEGDRVGRARVESEVTGRSAHRQVGDERTVLEVDDLDRVEVAVEALDERGHQVVRHRTGQCLTLGGDGDRGRLGTADHDRQHPVRRIVLAQHEQRHPGQGIDLDSDEIDQQHAIMIRVGSAFLSCPQQLQPELVRVQRHRRLR